MGSLLIVWLFHRVWPPGRLGAGLAGRGILEEGGAMDPTEKLYRSRTNRQVAGVCGGLAKRFNVDVTLVRVLFVLLGIFGGSGIVLYIALWIIVPNEPPVGGAP
jgi:phage shock protein C